MFGISSKDFISLQCIFDMGGNYTLLVDKVVRAILYALPAPPLKALAFHLVDLKDSSMQVIKMLYDMEDNEGILGICGMVEIGKTTLAKEIYNQQQSNFDSRCFLNDVKEVKRVAIMDLQVKMVVNLLHVDVKKIH